MSVDIPAFSTLRVPLPNPGQQAVITELEGALRAEGLPADGVGAYLVPTTEGAATYVTRSPEQFLLQLSVLPTAFDVVSLALSHPPTLASNDLAPRSGAEWRRNNSNCFIVDTDGFHRLVCWTIFEQAGDSDPGISFWILKLEAQGHSKHARHMDRMHVEARPWVDSGKQTFDGIPEPSETLAREDSCRTIQFGLSVTAGSPQVGLSVNWTMTTCETYTPKLYDDHGHHATIWKGNPDVDDDQVRHVKFLMPIRTDAGELPSWEVLTGQHTI